MKCTIKEMYFLLCFVFAVAFGLSCDSLLYAQDDCSLHVVKYSTTISCDISSGKVIKIPVSDWKECFAAAQNLAADKGYYTKPYYVEIDRDDCSRSFVGDISPVIVVQWEIVESIFSTEQDSRSGRVSLFTNRFISYPEVGDQAFDPNGERL